MRTSTGLGGTGGPHTDLGGRRRADIYSDEALWRARYAAAAEEARFWENFAWLKPYGVPTSTRVTLPPPIPPRRRVVQLEKAATIPIPQQRRRPGHPAVQVLTERILRDLNNRGGRA